MSLPTFVKTYKSLIAITIFILIGVIAFFFINNLIKENENLKQEVSIIRLQKEGTVTKIIKEYVDSSGSTHFVIEQKANNIQSRALSEGTAVSIGLLDTVSTALKIAKDQIQQITKVNYSVSEDNVLLRKKIDSLTKKPIYAFKNNYLDYSETDVDSLTRLGKYTYTGDILYTDYFKKTIPIIGSNHFYTDIYSSDPNFRLGSVQRLTIEHPQKELSLKLRTGGLYNPYTKSLLLGGKLELGFNRFTITGASYYNLISNSHINLLGLDYTLISF